jgi:Skp family chaperone for outer membrane proteins
MTRLHTRSLLPWLLLVGVLLAGLVSQAVAMRTMMAQPTAVAVIRLPELLNELQQRADAEIQLREMATSLDEQDQAKRAELEGLRDRLEAVPEENRDEIHSISEEIRLKLLKYEGWRRFELDRLDVEKSLRLRDLYRSVRAAVEQYANANGYDIVVVDDHEAELSVNPQANASRENQIRQQMLSRRVLHANTAVDITDDLVRQMNNEYNAGG